MARYCRTARSNDADASGRPASSSFPLYERDPHTFVLNIFWAKPGDYRKATQRVYHSAKDSSFIELPLAAR
jgi:hypothetical protein